METILNILGWVAVFYVLGFLFVMIAVAQGYQGGDLLSEHYRAMLQLIFK